MKINGRDYFVCNNLGYETTRAKSEQNKFYTISTSHVDVDELMFKSKNVILSL